MTRQSMCIETRGVTATLPHELAPRSWELGTGKWENLVEIKIKTQTRHMLSKGVLYWSRRDFLHRYLHLFRRCALAFLDIWVYRMHCVVLLISMCASCTSHFPFPISHFVLHTYWVSGLDNRFPDQIHARIVFTAERLQLKISASISPCAMYYAVKRR